MFCAGITLLVSISLLHPAHWLRDPCVSKCLWMENRSTASLFIKKPFRHFAWPKLATNWRTHQRTHTHTHIHIYGVDWKQFRLCSFLLLMSGERWDVANAHTHTQAQSHSHWKPCCVAQPKASSTVKTTQHCLVNWFPSEKQVEKANLDEETVRLRTVGLVTMYKLFAINVIFDVFYGCWKTFTLLYVYIYIYIFQ